ncbi:MAG TPA: alpha/beta hydrolase [Candidatus Limnocylindrales bacterium]
MDRGTPEVTPADSTIEPSGFVVLVGASERIHFLDWGGAGGPGVLLVHGLAATAWAWTPVARRLAGHRRTVAMDLRGHGLSDSPTSGYDPDSLADDVVAVAEGSGLLTSGPIVLAGHGFGAMVAAWTAARLGGDCAGLVLVDGGWEDIAATSGLTADEFLRGLDEPPEVLRSMDAYLADRRGFDPATWDADQEQAARAAIVELPAGRVVSATRPHALAACVESMLEYDPAATLAAVDAPIAALVAAEDEAGTRRAALAAVQQAVTAARSAIRVVDLGDVGHNVMRYRPRDVTETILDVVVG